MTYPHRIRLFALALLVGVSFLAGCDDDHPAKPAQANATRNASAESSDKPLAQQPEQGRNWLDDPAPNALAWLVVCALPLVLCWYLLHGLRRDTDDAEISRLLVEEIVADRPLILPSPSERSATDQGSWSPPRPPVIRKIER